MYFNKTKEIRYVTHYLEILNIIKKQSWLNSTKEKSDRKFVEEFKKLR